MMAQPRQQQRQRRLIAALLLLLTLCCLARLGAAASAGTPSLLSVLAWCEGLFYRSIASSILAARSDPAGKDGAVAALDKAAPQVCLPPLSIPADRLVYQTGQTDRQTEWILIECHRKTSIIFLFHTWYPGGNHRGGARARAGDGGDGGRRRGLSQVRSQWPAQPGGSAPVTAATTAAAPARSDQCAPA